MIKIRICIDMISDDEGPKIVVLACLYYSQERRRSLKKEDLNRNGKIFPVVLLIHDEWRKMSQKAREPYIALEKADKDRYSYECEFHQWMQLLSPFNEFDEWMELLSPFKKLSNR